MSIDEAARAASGAAWDPAHLAALRRRNQRATEAVLAPQHGVDTRDLAQTGWGVVFPADADPSLRTALAPLLQRRRDQAAAAVEHRYREFTGSDGYRPGESKQQFLRRHGSGPGPVVPDVMPYYLLLVGGPDEIPFEFQHELGVQHAVGRLAFDEPSGYAWYAAGVVAAEQRPARGQPTRVTLFGPRNTGDPATALSADHLIEPLAATLRASPDRWQVQSLLGARAAKAALVDALGATPDLLVTASHGVGFPAGHPLQRSTQGALLCQDWPGPGTGPVDDAHWFDCTDVDGEDLTGLVAFVFACFGAGTPELDAFDRDTSAPRVLAPRPFVAGLPRALLGRDGSAAAVVAHVDRSWAYSFLWPGVGSQTEVYRSTIAALADGQPIGAALSFVTDRYAELVTDLDAELERMRLGRRGDDRVLAGLWTASRDARGFLLLGDPAVRLATAPAPSAVTADRRDETSAVMPPPAPPPRATIAAPTSQRSVGDRAQPVEVATYVSDDPASVGYDPATGRITGATLALISTVNLDGTGVNVVSTQVQGAELVPAVEQVHARMVEISLATRRAHAGEGASAP